MKSLPAPARLSLVLSLLLWIAATARAQTTVPREERLAIYPWADASKTVSPTAPDYARIVDAPPGMGGRVLEISNPGPHDGMQVSLLVVDKPPITADFYFLRGQIRYEGVSGESGCLEMWNQFPGGGRYFSRTLAENPDDPMGRIRGTHDWRPVLLPFNATGATAHPDQLRVNIFLPGRGTVYLSEWQLFQVRAVPPSPPRTGGSTFPTTPGGFAGPGFCLTAAMTGLSWLARRGRHRAFVVAGAWIVTSLTVVLLLAALWQAWTLGLPASEWTLRTVPGVFVCGMFTACAWSFQRRYRRAEWRRMAAMDA